MFSSISPPLLPISDPLLFVRRILCCTLRLEPFKLGGLFLRVHLGSIAPFGVFESAVLLFAEVSSFGEGETFPLESV